VDLGRHDSGVRRHQGKAPDGFHHQGPDAPSAHRRPGYPLSGCVPAEPDSVSPGSVRLASAEQCGKPPSDTGVMPQKILLSRCPTEKWPKVTHSLGRRAETPSACLARRAARPARMSLAVACPEPGNHGPPANRFRTVCPTVPSSQGSPPTRDHKGWHQNRLALRDGSGNRAVCPG